jgi:hypothetical protein
MDTRSPGRARAPRRDLSQLHDSDFLLLLIAVLLMVGCGAPGEPLPPAPPIPAAISDLTARQVGDAVVLTFTMPRKSVMGETLKEVPTLEILRGSLKPDGAPDPKSFHVVDTVPGVLVANYLQQGKVQFSDPTPPAKTGDHAWETLVYSVRTRVSEKKSSGSSNEVSLSLYPVPAPIDSLDARVTESGIQLQWSVPTHTSGGEPLAPVEEYHLYRGELDPSAAEGMTKDPLHQVVWKSPLLRIDATSVPQYLDAGFDYEKTYGYLVRSVISAGGTPLESSDSRIAVITPKDTFPPVAPQGIVAAVLPEASPASVVVDLSWSINVEPDLAGYRVYRSESEDQRGELLTPGLLLTPAYRDNSVRGGRRYWFIVTAVDRSGNESAPSRAAAVEIPQATP